MARVLLAWLLTACTAGTSPDSATRSPSLAAIADDVRFGGCAPLRYRSLEPAELSPSGHTPRPPPMPVSFNVTPMFTSNPAEKAEASAISTQLRSMKSAIIACIEDELDDGNIKFLSLALVVHAHGFTVSSLRGLEDAGRQKCAENVIRSNLKAKLTKQAFLNFRIQVGSQRREPTPSGPVRSRGIVEILSNSDRVEHSLALTSSVVAQRDGFAACLARNPSRGSAHAMATLTLVDGSVTASEVGLDAAAPGIGPCFASVLSGVVASGSGGGVFQCALGLGAQGAARSPVRLSLSGEGLRISAESAPLPINSSVRPPGGELYAQLSALRFADIRPSPADAALIITPDVRGEAVIAVVEAARAADFAIVSVVVGDAANSPQLSGPSVPRLSRSAGRYATLTVIVTVGETWIGHSSEMGAVVSSGDRSALYAAISELAGTPGIHGRQDVVVGIDEASTGTDLAPVLDAVGREGFTQVEITSAKDARSRLAQ